MGQLFRFFFIVVVICYIPMGFYGIYSSWRNPEFPISEKIFAIIGTFIIGMAFCLAARWCNKGNTFDIVEDGLYVLKNMGIGCLIYLSIAIIGLFLGACTKFFSF